MSKWERRYFAFLGVVATLSLVTIGVTVPVERFVDPAEETYRTLLSSLGVSPASADAADPESADADPAETRSPELQLDEGLWPLGAAPLPCVAALEGAEHSSRLLPPLELDETELGCSRFD